MLFRLTVYWALDSRIKNVKRHSAPIFSSLQTEVSSFAPVGSVRIFYEPIIAKDWVAIVPAQEHRVIDFAAAAFWIFVDA